MASWTDLSKRLESIGTDDQLHIEATYHSGGVPRWLAEPIDACEENSGCRAAVTVVNSKGSTVDGALVVMALGDWERLIGGE